MKSITYPLAISVVIVLITFGLFSAMEKEFSELLDVLKTNPIKFGLVSFLILAADIILPVPSSIILYINGYFLGVLTGTTVSMSGLMVGCLLGYYLGKAGSKFFQPDRNTKADQILKKYGPSAIFLTRGIPVLSESICFVCGYNRINFKQYLLLNFIGYLPVSLLHAIFGKMGHEGANTFLLSFGCSIAISIAFWFFGNKIIHTEGFVSEHKT
ncbi:MAG: VTT domain-containing protein [Saprospiraceae bacterium]|nr:VTT domain-containing protein [Saprospiraceae bacterium]